MIIAKFGVGTLADRISHTKLYFGLLAMITLGILLIVGGGPGGLAAAIKLKQLAAAKGQELSVCLIETPADIVATINAFLSSGAIEAEQVLVKIVKGADGELETASSVGCRFVPLIGRQGW